MKGKTKMASKKMMRGGMAKKKMRGGGMAKMAQKKMMRGGMAKKKMMRADLEQNTEFRIKWPRGEMGSLPADSEQFMLIEHLASELEKLQNEIEGGKAPYDQQQKLTLEFYEKRITNLEENIEKIRNGG